MNSHDIGEDDAETQAFLEAARAAMSAADPPPSDVSVLAKLAYELRDVQTVEATHVAELAGVRSTGTGSGSIVSHGDATFMWSVGESQITGLIQGPDTYQVQLETAQGPDHADRPEDVEVAPDSSFECRVPNAPFRFVIVNAGERWATPWDSAP